MTDRKKGIKPFFDGFAPPAKKVITADFEVNEVRANDMSEQKKKKVKPTEKLMSLDNRISSLKKNNTEDWQKFHLIKISWTHIIETWTHIPTKTLIDISHFFPYSMNLYIQKNEISTKL